MSDYLERKQTISDYINLVVKHPEKLDEVADILTQRSFTLWYDYHRMPSISRETKADEVREER